MTVRCTVTLTLLLSLATVPAWSNGGRHLSISTVGQVVPGDDLAINEAARQSDDKIADPLSNATYPTGSSRNFGATLAPLQRDMTLQISAKAAVMQGPAAQSQTQAGAGPSIAPSSGGGGAVDNRAIVILLSARTNPFGRLLPAD